MKNHVLIIITVAVAFSSFMLGYSLPPFMEVGFGGGGEQAGAAADSEAELMKQYENLYKNLDK